MSLLNRLFMRRNRRSGDATAASENQISSDDLVAKLKQSTMDIDTFREAVIRLIWFEDDAGLRNLCRDQIAITPIFISKVIEEIAPDNKWNDVLWLFAQRVIVAGGWPHYLPLLEEKRHLVRNPEAGRKVMEPFVVVSKAPVSEANAQFPAVILRLLQGDMSGINHEDDTSIDKMFADQVILGPGFFRKYLAGIEFPYGDRAMMQLPLGSPPRLTVFEGRVLRGKVRVLPLVHDGFEAILARYRTGKIRQATKDERDLFYALIDFEITGRPVYVIDAEDGRLLIYLEEDKRIKWIESLDIWVSEARKEPLGSINRSTLDALGKEFK
jgi:hypothetical protein